MTFRGRYARSPADFTPTQERLIDRPTLAATQSEEWSERPRFGLVLCAVLGGFWHTWVRCPFEHVPFVVVAVPKKEGTCDMSQRHRQTHRGVRSACRHAIIRSVWEARLR